MRPGVLTIPAIHSLLQHCSTRKRAGRRDGAAVTQDSQWPKNDAADDLDACTCQCVMKVDDVQCDDEMKLHVQKGYVLKA